MNDTVKIRSFRMPCLGGVIQNRGAAIAWPLREAARAAWPTVAGAQQTALPVIGLLDQRSPEELADRLRGFHQGFKEAGYIEGDNVATEYRWQRTN